MLYNFTITLPTISISITVSTFHECTTCLTCHKLYIFLSDSIQGHQYYSNKQSIFMSLTRYLELVTHGNNGLEIFTTLFILDNLQQKYNWFISQLIDHGVLASTVSTAWEWWKQQRNMKMFPLLWLSDFEYNRDIGKEPGWAVLTSVETYPVYAWIHCINYARQLSTSSIIICSWRTLKYPTTYFRLTKWRTGLSALPHFQTYLDTSSWRPSGNIQDMGCNGWTGSSWNLSCFPSCGFRSDS